MSRNEPTPAQREAVYERSGMRCERCGQYGSVNAVHHRLTKRRGGDHRLSNIVLVCDFGGCHDVQIHGQPTKADAEGWLLPTGSASSERPALTPHGWVLFDDSGGWTPCPSPSPTEDRA